MADLNSHNLAYDYSIYDEEELSREKPKTPKAVSAPARRTVSIIKAFLLAACALALLCYMIYGRVELSSLYSQQSELETELSRLRNENVSLESELAQKTGLTKVEEYAENQLGLKKLDKYQIEYVEVPKSKVAEADAPEDDNVFVSIKNWFMGVLEYIGAQ
ncbi:MAG: cell division protein FtsL [Ruminococcus sp.]|nr:cell division protein FtsL [Ruminococcus sp.]